MSTELDLRTRTACDLADWLKVVCDELEGEIIARHDGVGYDDLHPAMKRRFTRDMQSVVQARALLRYVKDVFPEWPRPAPSTDFGCPEPRGAA